LFLASSFHKLTFFNILAHLSVGRKDALVGFYHHLLGLGWAVSNFELLIDFDFFFQSAIFTSFFKAIHFPRVCSSFWLTRVPETIDQALKRRAVVIEVEALYVLNAFFMA